jgi:hypothetical protein
MRILLFIALLLSSASLSAQKIFSEGRIRYDVYVNGEAKPSGLYVITVKGGNIRRELSMNNGYSNVTLFHFKTGKTYSLAVDGDEYYALELSAEEVQEKNKRFSGAQVSNGTKSRKLAGQACLSAEVVYTDGEKVSIFFTPDYVPQHETFNAMFPGLKGLALEYEVRSSKAPGMKFVATEMNINPVESGQFEVPAGYRILTRAELEKLH